MRYLRIDVTRAHAHRITPKAQPARAFSVPKNALCLINTSLLMSCLLTHPPPPPTQLAFVDDVLVNSTDPLQLETRVCAGRVRCTDQNAFCIQHPGTLVVSFEATLFFQAQLGAVQYVTRESPLYWIVYAV